MARDTLDLHGKKTDEVEDLVDRFLMNAQEQHLKRIRIMTGKGTGAVRNVVTKYLKLGGFPWKYEKLSNGKDNEGVLVVFLD
ncbi:MAG: Smr/MutS family protein [Oligoflexia bacterium]|nr:Smr/MutS family protein [Oligoflexia bacterium]